MKAPERVPKWNHERGPFRRLRGPHFSWDTRSASIQAVKAHLLGLFWACALACAPPDVNLLLPDSVSALRSGLLFVHAGDRIDSAVREAHAIDLDHPQVLRFAVEPPGSLSLMLYSASLSELHVAAGGLTRLPAGSGRAPPRAQLVYSAVVDDEPAWRELPASEGTQVAWELPGVVQPTLCQQTEFVAWPVPGLHLVQPRRPVAPSQTQVIIGGHRTEGDIEVVRESLLVSVRGFEDGPTLEVIGEPWPGERVVGLVVHSSGRVVGTTDAGRAFKLDPATLERSDVPGTLERGRSWKLATGRDGFLVAYDGTSSSVAVPDPVPLPPMILDPNSLRATVLETPEPINELEVVDAGFLIAAAKGTIYRYDGAVWTREFQLDQGLRVDHFAVDDSGTRIMAVVSSTFVFERSLAGEWSALPPLEGSYGLRDGVFFSTGDYLTGGGGGIFTIWDGSIWCEPETRALSRGLRGFARVPGSDIVFTVSYSETEREDAVVARLLMGFGAD